VFLEIILLGNYQSENRSQVISAAGCSSGLKGTALQPG